MCLQVQPFCRIARKTTRTVWTASAIEQGCKRCNRDVFAEVCRLHCMHKLLSRLLVNELFICFEDLSNIYSFDNDCFCLVVWSATSSTREWRSSSSLE